MAYGHRNNTRRQMGDVAYGHRNNTGKWPPALPLRSECDRRWPPALPLKKCLIFPSRTVHPSGPLVDVCVLKHGMPLVFGILLRSAVGRLSWSSERGKQFSTENTNRLGKASVLHGLGARFHTPLHSCAFSDERSTVAHYSSLFKE